MAFAVLYLPLIAELGASRGETAAIQGAVLLLGGAAAPLVGHALDRVGPRLVLQVGATVAAVGIVAASQAASLATVLLWYGVVAGLGLAALGSQTNLVIAALWFPRARGRAIAVADLGTGFGAFCFIPLGQALVSAFGWRTTLVVWAGVLLAIVVPISALQRLPAGPPAAAGRSPVAARRRGTLSAMIRVPAFWWLAATRFFAGFAFPLVNTHSVAYTVGQGVTPAVAASALGVVSLVSLAGRMTTGVLADRIGRPQTLAVMFSSAALGIGCLGLLAIDGSAAWLWAFVLLFGLAQGSSGIVVSARAADVFAGPRFGLVYGWLALAIGPGEALGVWTGGAVYDAMKSYLPAFGVVVVALAAALVALWRVRPEPGTPVGGRWWAV
jgi:MFS family permease